MDPILWNLCQRDQLLALRDQARKQQAEGNIHAEYMARWVEHILACEAHIATYAARTPRKASGNTQAA